MFVLRRSTSSGHQGHAPYVLSYYCVFHRIALSLNPAFTLENVKSIAKFIIYVFEINHKNNGVC